MHFIRACAVINHKQSVWRNGLFIKFWVEERNVKIVGKMNLLRNIIKKVQKNSYYAQGRSII